MIHPIRLSRSAAALVALATATVGLVVTGPSAEAAQAGDLSLTHYGFQSTATGTRVTVGAASLKTLRNAYSTIACTRMAGRSSRAGSLDAVNEVNPLVKIDGFVSSNRTYRDGRRVGAVGTSTIGSVLLGPADSLHLSLDGLTVTADAFHKATGYGATTGIRLGDLEIVDPTGSLDPLVGDGSPLGTLLEQLQQNAIKPALQTIADNGVIEIPNLGSIGVGRQRTHKGAGYAVASVDALILRLDQDGNTNPDQGDDDSTDSTVRLGHAWSRIAGGASSAVFQGAGRGAQFNLVDGQTLFGRINSKTVPCEGTDGLVRRSRVTNAGPMLTTPLVNVGTMTSKVSAEQLARGAARAWSLSEVASVDMSQGALSLKLVGITSKANVFQSRSGRITKHARGTGIAKIILNGEEVTPKDGLLTFDGGVLETNVVRRLKRGIVVTAARVTMLDGNGPVLNFGISTMRIRRN